MTQIETPPESRTWPFPVAPPEQRTPDQRVEIEFLDAAYRAGFAPRANGLEVSAGNPDGLSASLFYRGRERGKRRWEVYLSADGRCAIHCWVTDFPADAVLDWLRNGLVEPALEAVKSQVIRGPAIWPDGRPER
jgi:hypothetical protein